MTTQAVTQRGPVTLTSHPLQRVGAFALMALAGVDDPDRDPESLTPAKFEVAVAVMRADVAATAELPDTKASGAFWLSASYLLWPNSPMNSFGRAKASPQRRRELIPQDEQMDRSRSNVTRDLARGNSPHGWAQRGTSFRSPGDRSSGEQRSGSAELAPRSRIVGG